MLQFFSPAVLALCVALSSQCSAATLNSTTRLEVIDQFNPQRNFTNSKTPIQVGNGNFAFNADITGLQTIRAFNTLSSWGWHNSTLPSKTLYSDNSSTPNVKAVKWWVDEDQPGAQSPEISQWLIRNPHRINLGRIGLLWEGKEIVDWAITQETQSLNLSRGVISSIFSIDGVGVTVDTVVHPSSDTVAFEITSEALQSGNLTIFLDFPYPNSDQKFEEPFVGNFNAVDKHTTNLTVWGTNGEIRHDLDATTYYASFAIGGKGKEDTMVRQSKSSHRYVVQTDSTDTLQLSVSYSLKSGISTPRYETVREASETWWKNYWTTGAFVDCTETPDPRATELQRRIILSQYLQAVNSAGSDPPQESGLVNNGWYGKFHLEMSWWHLAHWTRWSKWDQIESAIPYVYNRFIAASLSRAKEQGLEGARWGKTSDPDGNSAPDAINGPLIWQQPHPFYFAELEYRAFPTNETLEKWANILSQTASFMTSFAKYNNATKVYDLGPPLHIAGENNRANSTKNPAFELAYWRFGLDIAAKWYKRQGLPVPGRISDVYEHLAQFPVQNGSYVHYEGIENMWTAQTLTQNHPMLLGMNGMLPPDPRLDAKVFATTVTNVERTWNMSHAFGWDFPLMAMTAARMSKPGKELGEPNTAVDWLLHPNFEFDDAGFPLGGENAKTPYFPAAGGLLMAVAMIADGERWPKDWVCEVEGFGKGL